jgi:hypothetical protein
MRMQEAEGDGKQRKDELRKKDKMLYRYIKVMGQDDVKYIQKKIVTCGFFSIQNVC